MMDPKDLDELRVVIRWLESHLFFEPGERVTLSELMLGFVVYNAKLRKKLDEVVSQVEEMRGRYERASGLLAAALVERQLE